MAPKLQLQLPRGQQRLQQIPRVRMCEEAWGSEAEESQEGTGTTLPAPAKTPAVLLHEQQLRERQQQADKADKRPTLGPLPLQALCLSCLSEYLEELLDCGHEVLQFVPAHSKAVLAAVAKRKGLMDDEALRMLADEDWVVLDLAGCSNITAAGLAAVLPMLGYVAAVDLTACGGVRAATLRLLAASCPAVQELRLGATQQSNSAGTIAIPELLPTLATPQISLLPSSWDETESSLSCSTGQPPDRKSPASRPARLQQLQTLMWPSAPLKIEQLIQTKFTKVALNPPWKNTQALDQHLIDQLTPGCLEVQQEPNMEPDQSSSQLPSLAERFRMAYISRSQRIAAVMDRQYKREQRRRLRQDTVLQAVAKFNQQHR